MGYSYTRLGSGTDPDVPDGSASVTNLVDASGAPNATWAIGDINFSNTLPVVVYEFTFTNYSEVDVEANITVTQGTGLQTLVAQNKVKITQGLSTVSMAKYDGTITSSQKASYKIVVELLSYTTSFPANTELSVNVNFEQGEYVEILDESAYPMLLFTSNGDGTASVMMAAPFLHEESFKIPSKILIDNVEYSVTAIENEGPMYGLKYLEIPDSISYISEGSFTGYEDLISVVFSKNSKLKEIRELTFSECVNLQKIEFLDNSQLETIGPDAFFGCSSLSSITIPEGVTSIGEFAFSGCSNLTSITIPEGVTNIGRSAFSGCNKLNYTKYKNGKYLGNTNNSYMVLVDTTTNTFTNFTINNDCKFIHSSAFSDCSSLTSVTIPESVTSIGSSAFSGCTSLKYIHLQGDLTSAYSLSGTWVKTADANMPTSWTPTVTSMQTADYYHQQSAWESAT